MNSTLWKFISIGGRPIRAYLQLISLLGKGFSFNGVPAALELSRGNSPWKEAPDDFRDKPLFLTGVGGSDAA